MSTEVITFGCRLNSYESEVMRGLARDAGLDDAVIVNTCAVTAEAERQARQAIRRARRQRPGARIIVTGCAAQIDPGRYADMPEVDRVLGNADKLDALNFDPAATEDVVASKRIPKAFSTSFAVAPRDEDYYLSIFCTKGQGRYVSKAFTFDSEKTQQTVDLGYFVF